MEYLKRISLLLLALVMALSAGCRPRGNENEEKDADEYVINDESLIAAEAPYGQERVFYEIFVGSFSDSDGDGIGDLRGIIDRMDYLNDGDPNSGKSLGVEGIWLTPIFRSPSYHKYDVTDYYQIDGNFGTEEDLKELIALCHERGVYLILDLVLNHTGSMNEWFNKFVVAHRNGDVNNEFYDFYTWYDSEYESAPAGRTFAPISGTKHYYECNFSDDMPELNFDSSYVRQKVLEVAKYYIDLGVDGFRFDAAKYVYFGDHKASLEFWNWYMEELRRIKPDIYTVAEVWDGDGITDIYMNATNCFDFAESGPSGIIAEAAKKGDVNKLTSYTESYIKRIKGLRSGAAITPFISNHDMDRSSGYLTVASFYMQMGANLYILGPGTPFIYYGEEIGMRGSRGSSNTDANRRLAMLWGDEDKVKDPSGASYSISDQSGMTVAEQKKDENSLFNYYKKLIMIRKANPEIALGEYKALDIKGMRAGGFVSTYNGSSVIVIHNTTGSQVTIDLSTVTDISVSGIRALIGKGEAKLEGNILTLDEQTSVVLK